MSSRRAVSDPDVQEAERATTSSPNTKADAFTVASSPFETVRGAPSDDWISPSRRATLRRSSGCIVSMSMMSAQSSPALVAVAHQLRGDRVAVGSRTLEHFAQTAKVTEHAPRGRDTSRNSLVPLGASESPRLALGPAVSVPRYLAPTTGRGKRDLWHEKWSQATSRPAWFPRGTSALGSPRFPAGTGSWLSHPYPQVLRVALRL